MTRRDVPGLRMAVRLLRACLFSWPPEVRKRDGESLLTAFTDAAHAETWSLTRLIRESAGECAAIARAGLGMRLRSGVSWLGAALSEWPREVRFAFRALFRAPGFTAVTVISLGGAIGVNAAVLGVVQRVLFPQPSFERPDELVFVWSTQGRAPDRVPVAAPDVAVLRERSRTLRSVAFMNRVTDGSLDDADGGGTEHVRLAVVTPDLFSVLGVRAAVGRTLDAGDGAADGSGRQAAVPDVVVLSDALWRRTFGGSRSVLGRTVRLNGRPAVVVGVMPPDFAVDMPPEAAIGTEVDVWVPLGVPLDAFQRTGGRRVDQDSDNTGAAIARLAPGATLASANDEMRRIAAQLQAEVPAYAAADLMFRVRDLRRDATEHLRGLLAILAAGVGIMLLIACLNVSTLLLARGSRRIPELSIRVALGAGRLRIVRHLASEILVLLMLGSGLALLVAGGTIQLLQPMTPAALGTRMDVAADARAFLIAVVVAGAVMLALAIVPALQSAAGESRGAPGAAFLRRTAGGRVRSTLVVTQVALSIVLTLGAVLLLQTVAELRRVRPGFEPDGALTFSLSLRTPGRYPGPGDRAALMEEISARLRQLPGVSAVGLTGHLPLSGRRWTQPYGLPGEPEAAWEERQADFRTVSSGYFAALGARVLEGRAFTGDEDLYEDRRVVIVDRMIARQIAPGRSALGLIVGFPLDGQPVHAEIVGVVEHIRHDALEFDGRGGLYVPYRQEASREVSFVVRTRGEPSLLAPEVRRTVAGIDPSVPIHELRTLGEYVEAAVAPRRFALLVLSGFALAALLSVGIGLYGLIALEVSRRTRDIGLRMAIGATRTEVVRSVLWMGMKLTLLGAVLGTAFSLMTWHSLRSLTYEASVADPATWLRVVSATACVTLLACWVPARRASRLDPTAALRID